MKQLSVFQSKMNNKITTIVAITTVFLMERPAYAQVSGVGGNLGGIKKVLGLFQKDLQAIIPIFAGVLLLCLAIAYAGRYIEKDTFVRWAIGVAVAGSATQIANMLFTQ
ncbi:VirB2 family type IV secretion system major pilin TrwL [Bartonella raoultii]|uniref:VirB2 family type IV secretion system major pilin TrwL n=1 Tax=Bartonella raoultii TaxID=1457020 RepID=A0ABS7IBH1_9HYPH|nr:VirB2 family type IV secretion system major pilin TrwL [Bartonella raoultii]MBX4335900.1 VirB2 family type IV secretion system major pilin TrwL [Bartonella raoultii]